MKRLKFLILFIFFVSEGYAQNFSKEQAQGDLKYTYDVLVALHPSVYRYTKPDELKNLYNLLSLQIKDDSISGLKLGEIINVLVAAVRCVHTSTDFSFKVPPQLKFNCNFLIYNNELYANNIKGWSTDTTLYKIVSINNILSSEIINKMMTQRAGDGFSPTFSEAYFSRTFNTYYNILFDCPDVCPVEIETPKGIKKTTIERTRTITARKFEFKWSNARVTDTMQLAKMYKISSQPELRILDINSFKGNYRSFYKKVFTQIKSDSVSTLVLDLRGNTGGNINHAFYLLSYLIDQDFYLYTERKRTDFSKYFSMKGKLQWVGASLLYDVIPGAQRWNDNSSWRKYRYSYHPQKENSFKGNVVVLTDGLSVSSSSLVASYLKYYSDAKVYGMETGGTASGNNGRTFPEIIIPASKIKLRLPLYHLSYFPGVSDNGRGVIPDEIIHPLMDLESQQEWIMQRISK